jgi:hypothetical protein
MDMSWEITMVAMLAITAGAATFVAWPLLTGRTKPEEFLGDEAAEPMLQRLLFQRDTVYGAMKELEFDLAMGNLSQEDFQQLQERYKRKAVAVLKRIDDAKAGKLRPNALLDEELLDEEIYVPANKGRRTAKPETDLDVEQEIQSYRKKSKGQNGKARAGAATCPSCGKAVADQASAFCNRCGARLK